MKILLTLCSWLYTLVVSFRNFLFDHGLFRSEKVPVPTICIGNLAVGGTGKTPHTIALVECLKNDYKVAVLSRGYKRKTKGFLLADNASTAYTIGDEPMQIHATFPDVAVAVCEQRVKGVKELLKRMPDLQVVILDDAFQHRKIIAGYSILLTAYDNLYVHDKMLPLGTLRDNKSNYLRANTVVVTKCPDNMKPIDMRVVDSTLKLPPYQSLFFSKMIYGNLIPVFQEGNPSTSISTLAQQETSVFMLTGIASPQYMQHYLAEHFEHIIPCIFPDHYNFSKKDMQRLELQFTSAASNKVIVTTEKDAMRLHTHPHFPTQLRAYIYALPIRIEIEQNKKDFYKKIQMYLQRNIHDNLKK